MSADAAGSFSLPRASAQEEPHPRPQMIRERWVDLCGEWSFAYDDGDVGEVERWYQSGGVFDRRIVVPFPPESPASGIADTDAHEVMWYRREILQHHIEQVGHATGDRLLLHFGAVDYRCSVWLNGDLVGRHEGGHTPFTFKIQNLLRAGVSQVLVVRVEDRTADVAQPRGKQDWLPHAHKVWYDRTSGIWQPVWLEATPVVAVEQVHWTADVPGATVSLELRLSRPPEPGTLCEVQLSHGDVVVGGATFPLDGQRARQVISVPALTNGQGAEELLWSPESPTLIDATVVLHAAGRDQVWSYLGIRSTSVGSGHFLLNDRPYFVRSVLSQGYWPTSHLAAPTPRALREEVELILALGFNAARIHQKVEDPRFIFWADRLGLLLWGEAPAALEFSPTAMCRTTREWLETLDRDRSHPSIVTWVPLNESWGVQHISHDPAQVSFVRALVGLTKAIDPTRPVISNDGWEHVESDILTIHDYADDPAVLGTRYATRDGLTRMLQGVGPEGRKIVLAGEGSSATPAMLTEFGGVSFAAPTLDTGRPTWGYSTVSSSQDFENRLEEIHGALRSSTWLAGTCYTQLTDTLQETNGLVGADRRPKLGIAAIRAVITGTRVDATTPGDVTTAWRSGTPGDPAPGRASSE
ncbi:glycoside hydrolase family 2 protein [Cellulomonas sp. KRMCY2]|uniref:glycoside hydrolase family 2 protein n=1 Tax=Cellulomonas sp. KRMCY2 TaxID=1304865 RepID=UPI0004B99DD9